MATLHWLSNPDRHVMVNPVVRVGCAVWLEGQSYDSPPEDFQVGSIWSPNLAFLRRMVGKSEYEVLTTVRCAGDGLDRRSESALLLLPEWGRRRFVFRDDQGTESAPLRVTRRVAPSTTRIALPSVSVTAVELPGGVAAGKGELDLSKALSIETKVSAAVDPSVRVSLLTGPDLSPALADMVASESGLEASGATGWLLYSLQEGRPERSAAVAFLEALETVGATAQNLADARQFDHLLPDVLSSTPFTFADADHGGGVSELAAARDYAVLLGWWSLDGLLQLARYDAQLRASDRSVVFAGEESDPQLHVDIELGEGEAADLAFSLVGLTADVTRFAVRATTVVDGVAGAEYSSIVSVALREGDLVWWEDEDNVTIIEDQEVSA